MHFFTNWYLYRWVSWNISEVINENSTSAFILGWLGHDRDSHIIESLIYAFHWNIFEEILCLDPFNTSERKCVSLEITIAVLPWIPEAPRNWKNSTTGSTEHPVVLCIQSEASIPIVGYSLIGQILTGDPHFYNTMFSKNCEKLRSTVICSMTRLQPGALESRAVLFVRSQKIRYSMFHITWTASIGTNWEQFQHRWWSLCHKRKITPW